MSASPTRDGDAYPSVSTISRFEPSAPSAPPHTGVDWRETAEIREFQRDPAVPFSPVSLPSMPLRTHLAVLRWVGLVVSAAQIAAAAAIPISTYLLVTKPFARLAIENYVHWGISLVAGGWGMMALGSMRPFALVVHVVFGAMVAAALAAHNNTVFADIELRCATAQQAFVGCGLCLCAAANTCTQADLGPDGSCPGCAAPPADLCTEFRISHNKVLLAVTGAVTVVVMAAPVVASLLALLRVECAAGLELCNRVSHALAVLNQQMAHMNARKDLSVPLDDLMASVHLIEAEGGPAMLQLAEQCRTTLARAGFNVPPRGHHDKKEEASIAVVASPPSAAPSHLSHHSMAHHSHHSLHSLSTSGAPLLSSDAWRTPSSSMPRPPQPAAMTFPAGNNPEGSIYYSPPRHS